MKKIYEEFLKIPKSEKICEKVLMTRISLSIAIMVFCLGAMGITAYAYFSCNITSAVTTIQSARYALDVEVTESNVSENAQPVVITQNEEGYYVFENKATTENSDVTDKTYEFVLKIAEDCTASVGFGKFEVLTDVNEDGSRQLYYTTPIGTYVEEGKTVENKEYKLQFLVPANKTVKVKVIAEWGTCARGPAMAEETTLVPDFVDSKYMHISFDDVSHSLLRLQNEEYTSIYDEPFFAWLKTLHDTYGAKFSIYTYVNVLQQVPDTFKEDFATAKDWLKIGLHAEDMTSSYADLDYETGKMVWNRFAENVLRITGTYESIDRMPKLENSVGTKDVLQGMKEADKDSEYKYGALGFIADNADQGTYYLDAAAWNALHTNDFYIDKENDVPFFTFVATDLLFGYLDADPAKRQEEYVAATSMHSCIAFAHEGQFYNENGFIDDIDGNTELLKSQVEELCKFANSKGIKFNYSQTRNFEAIQEAKLAAAKAEQEAIEKAAAEKEAAEKEAAEKETAEKTLQQKENQEKSEQEQAEENETKTETQSDTETETESEQL